MKLKILLIAVLAVAALYFVNKRLNEKKEYIPGVPAADTPANSEVRQKFTVGFLPVT